MQFFEVLISNCHGCVCGSCPNNAVRDIGSDRKDRHCIQYMYVVRGSNRYMFDFYG